MHNACGWSIQQFLASKCPGDLQGDLGGLVGVLSLWGLVNPAKYLCTAGTYGNTMRVDIWVPVAGNSLVHTLG